MIQLLKNRIQSGKLFDVQNKQYTEKLLLEDTVPAGQSKLGSIQITNLGDFYCQFLTGHFETLDLDGTIKDDGVSHLRGQLVDGSNQRRLFNDYIPLDLFLTPGRVKSALSVNVLTDPASNALFFPQYFEYLFSVNGSIQFDVKNDSDTPITYAVVFHGYRLLAQKKAMVRPSRM